MAFEYSYRFSVDEEFIPVHKRGSVFEKFVIEVRSNFIVKGREKERERIIAVGSERFGLAGFYEKRLRYRMVDRLRDYWMSDHQIGQLIDEAALFAKEGGGRRPTVVDLDVCTVQQEGEAIDATVDRAMRPDYLPPLDLRLDVEDPVNPRPPEEEEDEDRFFRQLELVFLLGNTLLGVRVKAADRGLSIMQACGICGGKPFVGSRVSTLRCAHVFHYHCIVRRFKVDLSCPICHHLPYDPDELPKIHQPPHHPQEHPKQVRVIPLDEEDEEYCNPTYEFL